MEPFRTSWHEAAHAVVAHLLGGEVRCVTLESEWQGHDGHTEVAWRGLDRRELARCEALVAWAGPLAELLRDGGVPDDPAELEPEVVASWRADHEAAERALGVLAGGPEERARIRRALLAELHELLEHPAVEERIARVADHLEAHGTLDAVLFEDTA